MGDHPLLEVAAFPQPSLLKAHWLSGRSRGARDREHKLLTHVVVPALHLARVLLHCWSSCSVSFMVATDLTLA